MFKHVNLIIFLISGLVWLFCPALYRVNSIFLQNGIIALTTLIGLFDIKWFWMYLKDE